MTATTTHRGPTPPARVVLAGWFSVDSEGNTGGDLLALETVARWLREREVPFVVAVNDLGKYRGVLGHPLIRADEVRPGDADALAWICGPLPGGTETPVLEAFAGKPSIALGVSVTDPAAENRFATVVARDRPGGPRHADLSFGSRTGLVPVVGLVYVHHEQPEYRAQREPAARDVVAEALADRDVAIVDIDTRLPRPSNRLRTPAQLESALARMDVVISTRLHGAVLALRNGVPAVAIDPVAGGAKLTEQMKELGWPLTVPVDELTTAEANRLLDTALRQDFDADFARIKATGAAALKPYRDAFFSFLTAASEPGKHGDHGSR